MGVGILQKRVVRVMNNAVTSGSISDRYTAPCTKMDPPPPHLRYRDKGDYSASGGIWGRTMRDGVVCSWQRLCKKR